MQCLLIKNIYLKQVFDLKHDNNKKKVLILVCKKKSKTVNFGKKMKNFSLYIFVDPFNTFKYLYF